MKVLEFPLILSIGISKRMNEVLNYEGKTELECFSIDLFIFSYLIAGINFVDIARLTDDNIMENRFVYIRKNIKEKALSFGFAT